MATLNFGNQLDSIITGYIGFIMISHSSFNTLPFHWASLCQQLWPISWAASFEEWGLQRCSLHRTEGRCAEQLHQWGRPVRGLTIRLYRTCTVGTYISPTFLNMKVHFHRRWHLLGEKSQISQTWTSRHTQKLIIMTWMSALAPQWPFTQCNLVCSKTDSSRAITKRLIDSAGG